MTNSAQKLKRWQTVGVATIALAVGLAGLGLFLSLQHVRSLTMQLDEQALVRENRSLGDPGQPAQDEVTSLLKAIATQTALYVGLTTLALASLSLAIWFLIRLVRREIALAELKANFVADVSHELKTPLALIRLYAETLQTGRIATEEKRQEYYSVIARESTRLTTLINGILDFSKIEAGRREYEFQPTDATVVVRDTYNAYCPQLEQLGFEHALTMQPHLPRIDADRDAISQVVVNLINNAIKYSQDEKHLAIDVTSDTRRGRRGVLISVHDRGIGIRPEDRARLTEGFFRAPDQRVREQGGTGLGLALVKRIVEAHNGLLDIESRLVKGSSFRVFLPASASDTSLAKADKPREVMHDGTHPDR